MAKMRTTVGVTVGIFNKEGKLLLRRRKEHDSITGIDYYGNWELPVVAVQEIDVKSIPYDYLCQELIRGVKGETGIDISEYLDSMPAFYPVMFKNDKGEYDLAMITPLGIVEQKPTEETIYVSPRELNDLANEFISLTDAKKQGLKEAKGLLSGVGKRQHRMALKVIAVASPNRKYRKEAKYVLEKMQQGLFIAPKR